MRTAICRPTPLANAVRDHVSTDAARSRVDELIAQEAQSEAWFQHQLGLCLKRLQAAGALSTFYAKYKIVAPPDAKPRFLDLRVDLQDRKVIIEVKTALIGPQGNYVWKLVDYSALGQGSICSDVEKLLDFLTVLHADAFVLLFAHRAAAVEDWSQLIDRLSRNCPRATLSLVRLDQIPPVLSIGWISISPQGMPPAN